MTNKYLEKLAVRISPRKSAEEILEQAKRIYQPASRERAALRETLPMTEANTKRFESLEKRRNVGNDARSQVLLPRIHAMTKISGLGINPLKSMGQVATQARRIENKAIRQQLSSRMTGGTAARMQQLGQRRSMAGTIRINADQMSKSKF